MFIVLLIADVSTSAARFARSEGEGRTKGSRLLEKHGILFLIAAIIARFICKFNDDSSHLQRMIRDTAQEIRRAVNVELNRPISTFVNRDSTRFGTRPVSSFIGRARALLLHRAPDIRLFVPRS